METAQHRPEQRRLSVVEDKIYNAGERLIPGVTHDVMEHIRHQSSYEFFCRVIREDCRRKPIDGVRILDLGFGAGWGCQLMASLPGASVVGVDISPECRDYAREHYHHDRVEWVVDDLWDYVNRCGEEFDYVVSRGVLEHVPRGLDIVRHTRWRRRAMIDVPYDERDDSNEHHVLSGIVEEDFAGYPDAELLYEDLAGVIYDRRRKPDRANMIMCVLSGSGFDPVEGLFEYPIPAWRPAGYQPPRPAAPPPRPHWGKRVARKLSRFVRKNLTNARLAVDGRAQD